MVTVKTFALSGACASAWLGSRGRFPLPTVISFAGPSIPSYTAAAMWGFTKRQGITILVIAIVALIVLIILVGRATSFR
jgi:hypothetical protein